MKLRTKILIVVIIAVVGYYVIKNVDWVGWILR